MGLTGKQKKYIKKHRKEKTLGEMASVLKVSRKEIEKYLEKRLGKGKYRQVVNKRQKCPNNSLQERILSFNLKQWFKKNKVVLASLALLVFITYANSLNNEFVSDDLGAIAQNPRLESLDYALSDPRSFVRPLLYFAAFKIGGATPFVYRLINIIFHTGVTLLVYCLISLVAASPAAVLAAVIFAVHPILTESVTWISGGAYPQYTFFLLLSLIAYIFSSYRRDKKIFAASVACFLLALASSEKAIVLPPLLLLFTFSFDKLRKNWKSLTFFFILALSWGLAYIGRASRRVATLRTSFYQAPRQGTNPLIQIPVAITSYLELIFWPKDLTFYHSEMTFTQTEYLIRSCIFLAFLGGIVYAYRRQRQVFFWLSFFIIALLPMLTPFGISWIVAERYVYLGAIGIFVVVAMGFRQLLKNEKLRPGVGILFGLIILALLTRTIVRNVDWKDQDTLWLATAKTSPSSSQNHNNLGDYYGRRGDFEKAIEEFKRAIELNPNYAGAYHNLANAYRHVGETDWAIENYQKAAELNPNLWQSHQNLAVSYFDRGQLDLAEENMKKAIEVNPENANLYLNLGIVYLRMEDKPRAEEAFQKARQLDPQIQTPPTQP